MGVACLSGIKDIALANLYAVMVQLVILNTAYAANVPENQTTSDLTTAPMLKPPKNLKRFSYPCWLIIPTSPKTDAPGMIIPKTPRYRRGSIAFPYP
ncbi:MAG: hypothetical protein RLZ12_14 [Bacillota bacterium]|jgi:hypothetical protein